MPTLTYAEIRNRAAQNAGIPSGSLSTTDASLLQGYLSAHIRACWMSAPWPTIRHVAEFTVSSRIIDRTVSATVEVGEIRAIWSDNPRLYSDVEKYVWWDRGDTIELEQDVTTAWLDYIEECPDLSDVASLETATFDIRIGTPRRNSPLARCFAPKGGTMKRM